MQVQTRFLILSLLSIFIACGEAPTSSNGQQNQPVSSEAPKTTTLAKETLSPQEHERISSILLAYYQDLSNEQLDADKYFASTVDKFYKTSNANREVVSNSIRRGFQSVEDRKIEMDVSSLRIKESPKGYIAEFDGEVEFVRTQDKSKVAEKFTNRVGFDEQFKIISYEALEAKATTSKAVSKTRSLAPSKDLGASQSVNKLVTAFERGDKAQINQFIHPELGMFLVTRPGAMSAVFSCKKIEEVYENQFTSWIGDYLKKMPCELEEGATPEFDCDTWSKEGCFIAPAQNYKGISELMNTLVEYEYADYSPKQISDAKKLEKYVSKEIVSTEAWMGMFFGNIGGKWYLLVLDAATYDCSA